MEELFTIWGIGKKINKIRAAYNTYIIVGHLRVPTCTSINIPFLHCACNNFDEVQS